MNTPAKNQKTPPTALETAVKLLSVRGYSERELAQKLLAKKYDKSAIVQTVDYCRSKGYLNDELFAADYAKVLSERGCGPLLIRKKLSEKGIRGDLAQSALAETDDPAATAQAALEFKLRLLSRESDPRKKREKAFRFLAGRGFSLAVIQQVLSAAGL